MCISSFLCALKCAWHSLDDGNGRITRLLTDLALAQAEKRSIRFYAMSVSILARRQTHYDILESTQRAR